MGTKVHFSFIVKVYLAFLAGMQISSINATLRQQSSLRSGIVSLYVPKNVAREAKNLRAGTKNFWFVFSGKYAPQSAHLWFANSERRYAKEKNVHYSMY
ncbi:DUF1661 domain-containing protein [Porphyromonas gulae]|uniref:DUF1661 domain-containing protein n=1 Tax=Porphyromonas gulae TaxID=111105 RepID=UPI0013787E36|nr:DUF1661 domain-containing protein [Porphyromonas gulae]